MSSPGDPRPVVVLGSILLAVLLVPGPQCPARGKTPDLEPPRRSPGAVLAVERPTPAGPSLSRFWWGGVPGPSHAHRHTGECCSSAPMLSADFIKGLVGGRCLKLFMEIGLLLTNNISFTSSKGLSCRRGGNGCGRRVPQPFVRGSLVRKADVEVGEGVPVGSAAQHGVLGGWFLSHCPGAEVQDQGAR